VDLRRANALTSAEVTAMLAVKQTPASLPFAGAGTACASVTRFVDWYRRGQPFPDRPTARASSRRRTGACRIRRPTITTPLLYAAGAADAKDAVSFPISGFDMGSLSMRSVLFGLRRPPARAAAGTLTGDEYDVQ